ncbi:MAG: dihydropteroate synthase [Clostridiales bacterium]|nr:dihydropteroate synthase [Clostridiales bacterium]
MLIVGELLNSSRFAMRALLEAKDKTAIQKIALAQEAAGAHYLDVNCGVFVGEETEYLCWLVDTVQEVCSLPLCLDSPDGKALKAALPRLKNGRPLINSISAERDRYEQILPLALEYKAKLIALAMGDAGIPATAESKVAAADRLYNDLRGAGVAAEDIYMDLLVQPIATTEAGAAPLLAAASRLRVLEEEIEFIVGLSNISYGLPNRALLNRCFLIQAVAAGIDSFILDPLDKELMGAYYAARALAGRDKYCSAYLKAHRSGYYGNIN